MTDLKINENFILMNQKEIYEFISGNKGFIELINLSFIKIKRYFPESKIYLEFREDPEYEGLNAIWGYVFPSTETYDENYEIFYELTDEIYELRDKFDKADYFLSLGSNDEYFRNRLNNVD
ncbi:MAG: hypothetical protein IKV87_07615 [Methanobrevibacter sp.]|nr:hypothetical protein [Methanobrevibacter sp.]